MEPLLFVLLLAAQSDPVLSFKDAAAFEEFMLPADDGVIKKSLETALSIGGAGDSIALAARLGPENALRAAEFLTDPGFRAAYRDLARYLDLFGPCWKEQAGAAEGWWSNYPKPASEAFCGEATKLLFSVLLWNQVHYCARLSTGEDKPKAPVPGGKLPPYRLDEPPVATHWLRPGALYAMTDAALGFNFAKTLRARAGQFPEKVRSAMLDAASELERETPNRELAALALAKILIRRYEQSHLNHLARLEIDPSAQPH